jgi:hypothetical protein
MRPKLTDAELIDLFNQRGSARQLAYSEGVSPRDLHRGWQRLKAKHLLPLQRPRDLYQPDADEPDNREHEFDGRPSVNAGDPDPLLTLLIKHHGSLDTK